MFETSILNIIAVSWFMSLWIGYAAFAKYKSRRGRTLSSVMSRQRLGWMERVLERENRVTDAILIANLERNCTFMASTSILVLAGLLSSLGVAQEIEQTVQALPLYAVTEEHDSWIHLKMLLLVFIYVYAFFTLTWSMRQFGFASVMIGSAPEVADAAKNEFLKKQHAYASSKIIDMAGHSYNFGLRAFAFSLAVLPWFFSPWYFMFSSTCVVFVLYFREFESRPYRVVRDYQQLQDKVLTEEKLAEEDVKAEPGLEVDTLDGSKS